MRTRRSPRNQEILFKDLFKPKGYDDKPAPGEKIDLDTAWWLSKRTKKMLEQDRVREAQKEAVRRALQKENPRWVDGQILITKSGAIKFKKRGR